MFCLGTNSKEALRKKRVKDLVFWFPPGTTVDAEPVIDYILLNIIIHFDLLTHFDI